MKSGDECQEEKATRYEGRFQASIPDNDCPVKACIMVDISQASILNNYCIRITHLEWNHLSNCRLLIASTFRLSGHSIF